MMVAYPCWSLALAAMSGLCLLAIQDAPEMAEERGYEPGPWESPDWLVVVGWVFMAIAAINVLSSLLLWLRFRWTWVLSVGAVVIGLPLALAPAATRAMLPWEDPSTGDGSPLATFISIVMLAAFFVVTIGGTGMLGFVWLVSRRRRIVQSRSV